MLYSEVWFLELLERLKPCFGGSFKVPGQGQASILNIETKAVILGFIKQEFKKSTPSPSSCFSPSLSWMSSTRQVLQAVSRHSSMDYFCCGRQDRLLLPSAAEWLAQHRCCLPIQHSPEPFHPTAPAGGVRLVSASPCLQHQHQGPGVWVSRGPQQPLTILMAQFVLPSPPAVTSPWTLGCHQHCGLPTELSRHQSHLSYWLWLPGLNSKLVAETSAEGASNNHSVLKYTRLSSKYICQHLLNIN